MNRRSVLLRLSERIYRLCLLAFPVDFRRKQGEETVRFFRDRARRAVRERGLGALPGLWLRAYPDALVQGLAERFCSGRRASPEVFGTELRQTVRGLVRSPSFSLPVVSTLALGLGATGVVVALARGVFLHPLPFPADDLLFVGQRFGGQQAIMTSPLALERLEEQSVVEEVAHFRTFVTTVTGVGDPIRYRQAIVSHDYFDVLGVAPALGREFEADEEGPSGPRLVIVSHAVWTTRLGADPDVLGRSIDLDGVPHGIIGVMPADFRGPTGYLTFGDDAIQLWVTSASDDVGRGAGFLVVRGLTRPASGATLEAVRTAAAAVGRTLAEEMGEDDVIDLTAVPFRERVVQGGRTALLILAVAAGLVLLVGCANVTNLVLARSLARQDDLTVRRALGAGRTDLVRHTVLETVVLGVVGGLLGLAIAHLGLQGLLSVAPPFPFRYAIRVEPLTVGVSLALALAVVLLAGLLAALRTVGGRAALTPSASRTASQTTGSWRLRKVFAVSQVSLAAGLLVGAMLLARSFQALLDVERGYSAEGVRIAHLTLPTVRYASAEERRATLEAIAERLAGRPEVEAVGYATAVPHMGINDRGTSVALADGLVRREEAEAWADFRGVTPGYLRVLGMELLLGRMLEEEDLVDGRPTAALVNRTFADRFLEDGRILGRRMALDGFEDLEVVGVVRDVKHSSLAQSSRPEVYVPLDGRYSTDFLTVKASGPDVELAPLMKRAVRDVDPLVPMERIPSLAELESAAVAEERTMMLLMLSLAGLGVLMASLGTYGVLAEVVSRRRREVGIRVALGASPAEVVGLVVWQGMRMVGTGLVAGLLLAFWGGRIMESALYGVSSRDLASYLAVALLLGGIGLLASWLPARRAVRVDPTEALRAE